MRFMLFNIGLHFKFKKNFKAIWFINIISLIFDGIIKFWMKYIEKNLRFLYDYKRNSDNRDPKHIPPCKWKFDIIPAFSFWAELTRRLMIFSNWTVTTPFVNENAIMLNSLYQSLLYRIP